MSTDPLKVGAVQYKAIHLNRDELHDVKLISYNEKEDEILICAVKNN